MPSIHPTPPTCVQNICGIPSLVPSIPTVCVYAIKSGVSIGRLWQKGILVESALEAACCFVLFITSIFLLSFSINEPALEMSLSLIDTFMIVYQVNFSHLFWKIYTDQVVCLQCGFLWQFYNPSCSQIILWITGVLQILCAIAVLVLSAWIAAKKTLIAADKTLIATYQFRITVLEIANLVFFAAEYTVLGTLYVWKVYSLDLFGTPGCRGILCVGLTSDFYRTGPACSPCILWWNIYLCIVPWALTIISLFLFLSHGTSYITSLWVSYIVKFGHSKLFF
jgi:hypothetical protein